MAEPTDQQPPPAQQQQPPPAQQSAEPDPWDRLGGIVEERVKGIFAGHVADHHTAPPPSGSKPPAQPAGSQPPPPDPTTGDSQPDDRGFLAKAFGFK